MSLRTVETPKSQQHFTGQHCREVGNWTYTVLSPGQDPDNTRAGTLESWPARGPNQDKISHQGEICGCGIKLSRKEIRVMKAKRNPDNRGFSLYKVCPTSFPILCPLHSCHRVTRFSVLSPESSKILWFGNQNVIKVTPTFQDRSVSCVRFYLAFWTSYSWSTALHFWGGVTLRDDIWWLNDVWDITVGPRPPWELTCYRWWATAEPLAHRILPWYNSNYSPWDPWGFITQQ